MPKPHPESETQQEWMSRCIPTVLNEGTTDDPEQAAAICASMWDEATDKSEKQMNERAYSVLEIKGMDDDKRVISGLATSPVPDRVGDIVEPMGVKFSNPLPLLWQHQHDKPIGHVVFDKPTKKGITFTATLPKIEEPGPLKDLVDMAWQSIKAKLVRGVSIGFRSLKHAYIDGGGVHFQESEVYELSAVTIPMHQLATIQNVKAMDSGIRRTGPVPLIQPKQEKEAKLTGGAVRLIK